MRVSSLSNDKVIDLLTKYFVPVWVSREHYQLAAPSDSESDELLRIDRERAKCGLEGGTVCVYILAPDGSVSATMRVQKASKPENLVPFLQKIVAEQKLTPRAPDDVRASTAAPRSPAKATTEGGIVLNVWTRFDDPKSNRGTAQDWVEWTASDCAALAPTAAAQPGDIFTVSQDAAGKLFQRLYPPTGIFDAHDCEVASAKLTATVTAVESGEVRLRLEGNADLKYPLSDAKADGKVALRLIGAARYDPARRAFTSFALASESAEYVWLWEGKPQRQKLLAAVEMQP